MSENNQSAGSRPTGLYIAAAVVVIVIIGAVVFMGGESSDPETAPEVAPAPSAELPAPALAIVTANIHDGVYTNPPRRPALYGTLRVMPSAEHERQRARP